MNTVLRLLGFKLNVCLLGFLNYLTDFGIVLILQRGFKSGRLQTLARRDGDYDRTKNDGRQTFNEVLPAFDIMVTE